MPRSTRTSPIRCDLKTTPNPVAGRRSVKSRSLASGKTLPASKKPIALERAEQVDAQLAVQHHDAVPAGRESRARDRLLIAQPIEREAAHRRIAAGEEALVGGQTKHLDDLTADFLVEPVSQAHSCAECQHRPAGNRQLAVQEALQVGLDEANLRSDRTRGDVTGENHLRSVRRIEQIARVAAVAEERARELRDTAPAGTADRSARPRLLPWL